MDYKKVGFKAGLEIHQQLDTHKLFCSCQSVITEDEDYSFERFLRPTQSELGDVDEAALAEAKKKLRFRYIASNSSTCLVEADEEPPHYVNQEAIDICLTVAAMLNAKPVDEIHFMRKIVIDGSNTGGFQRTALVATGGKLGDVGIQTISLEEDAARKLEEKGRLVIYGLDRLGIPLIEIATEPDIKSPRQAREVAERIGQLLHATGRVKHGLGTIRQDINISVSKGARVEVKGVQSLSSISRVAENEIKRQLGLIGLKKVVRNEVRRALADDTTEYMRPLPGPARMYPETDVPPVRITTSRIKLIKENLPELPEIRYSRFLKEYKLNREQAKQILSSGYENDFEKLVKQFPKHKNTILRTLLNTLPELDKENVNIQNISMEMLVEVFSALSRGMYSKEAVPEVLKYLTNKPTERVEDAINALELRATDIDDVQDIIRKIVSRRIDFVKKRRLESLGPLMGVVMKELRGKADGKLISNILKQEIQRVLSKP
jgi:Glu-tRNA(Gln) amidotransferase subunit E-like FAD-binding protein